MKIPLSRLVIALLALALLCASLSADHLLGGAQPQAVSFAGVTPVRPAEQSFAVTLAFTPFREVTSTAARPPAAASGLTRTPTRVPSQTPSPSPTEAQPTPTDAPDLPLTAQVRDISGFGQTLPLSCEARAAVDWARFFGVEIRELDFFNRLPRSNDPELGFVGSPYGEWGEIPPNSYGVHAPPVADLLRQYGLKAEAARDLSFNQLRAEIAANRPVIVWIVGHVEVGTPVQVKIDGQMRTVARFEHTVMVIGYDEGRVTILDDGKVYVRSIDIFLKSWAALENMAVLWAE